MIRYQRAKLTEGIGKSVCDALGLDADIVERVIIDLSVNDLVHVTVSFLPDERINDVIIPDLRQRGVVVNVVGDLDDQLSDVEQLNVR